MGLSEPGAGAAGGRGRSPTGTGARSFDPIASKGCGHVS